MKLLLLRHGEVEERAQGIFRGSRLDVGLSREGRNQVEVLGDWLRFQRLDHVYFSPMQRVRQTLAIIEHRITISSTIMEGLKEVDFGNWSGCEFADIQPLFGVNGYDWLAEFMTRGFPNGENEIALRKRVNECIQNILNAHRDGTVAIISHVIVLRMALAIILELPMQAIASFQIDCASITEVDLGLPGASKIHVNFVNLKPWLKGGNIPNQVVLNKLLL